MAIAAAVFVAGCDEVMDAPTAPTSAAQIEGPWRLQDLAVAGAAATQPPSPDRFTVTFAGDRLQARADCNTCGGGVSLSGAALIVGPLACTRAFCPSAPFDTQFTSLLDGVSTVRVDATRLWLTSSRGTLRFTR